jgi:hypothetical protein
MNPLEAIKKGIAAMKPAPSKPKVGADNPIKPVVEKNTGYLGDTARKVNKRKAALDEAAAATN